MNRVFTITLLLLCLLLNNIRSVAQDECHNTSLGVAQKDYEIGRLNECVSRLKGCIASNGFDYNEKLTAFRLCAKSYLAMDSVEQADTFIARLVTLDDNFQSEAGDPIRFRLRVAFIRTQLRALLTSSVSKKSENIELAPATIQILTAEDIQNRGYMDLESVFNDLPGFDISRSFGISYSVLYQRGYRSPALTERTMIMVDGIEDNDLWTNAAFITKQYPLSSVKRIEIIYGPASTIYGANAFCGVINIVTKDGEDIFNSGNTAKQTDKVNNFAINLQSGVASYNTKYVDGTAAIRSKDVVLTVTGRVYISDGVDLTSDPYWDGVPNYGNAAYASKMTMKYNADSVSRYVGPYFQVNSDSSKIVPTTAGINRADSLDKAYYKSSLKNAAVFRNNINDFYIAAKLSVHNFKFGFQYWNKNEGSIGDYVDNFSSQNSAYTNWQVREYVVYTSYDKKVSDHFNISSLTSYRYCDFGNDSKGTNFSGYGTGGVSDYGFITGAALPHFSTTNYYEASNQLRSELKGLYTIDDHFDVLLGTEFTTGIMQANYLTSTGTALSPALIYGTAGDSIGGNNFTSYTISGYATGSYKNAVHKFNIDLGGRVDDNKFREYKGYGTVFNPRVDAVYYPGSFIFKAIYAEAFLDASNQNKFSTASSRKLDNPSLDPERVKNIELSARYKFGKGKRNYVEVAAYRADYTHTLALVPVAVPTSISSTGFTNQYQDIGQSLVYGAQAASQIYVTKQISIYSNVTYSDPTSIFTSSTGADSAVRTGDIATISANAGVNWAIFKKLNLNVRVNIVGDKPTGVNTSVPSNPNTKISGFELLNATVGYRVIKTVLVQFGCNNILNTTYYTPGVRTADGATYAPSVIQPQRNYMAKIIVDLKK